MTSPRIAVVGCGYWGQNLVRNFNEIGVLHLVCDSSAAGRTKAAEIAAGVETTDNIEQTFSRPDIDAVAIATPAETHHSLGIAAMKQGKDVLVEKPLAVNYRQGLEMVEQADRSQRILMVGHLLEYHPAVLKLRELVRENVLGRVHYIYSNRLNFGKIRTEENALWSFAPHDVAVILRLVGELPIEVTSVGGSYITPNLADVTVSTLHFRAGLRAHIFVSWLNPFKEQKLVLVGESKMAVFNDMSDQEKLVLYNQCVELNNRQPVLKKEAASVVGIAREEPLRNECLHFLECIRTRQKPLTDGISGTAVLRVLQACQVSLQLNGRPVVMSEV